MKSTASCRRWKWFLISAILMSLGCVTFSFAADNLQYTYDNLNRLIRVENINNGQVVEYQYDAVGNRLQKRSTIPVTITASANSGGSISPSGAVTIAGFADQSFSIAPSAGYVLQDVLVDGVSVGQVTGYTFTGVTVNHTISAVFIQYTDINIGGSYYLTLQDAYNAAADGSTIRVKTKTFTESLNINRNVSVAIEGGYNDGFTAITGSTTLKGKVQTCAGGGALNIKNFVLTNQ